MYENVKNTIIKTLENEGYFLEIEDNEIFIIDEDVDLGIKIQIKVIP
jgi:hypothetical protein